MKVINWRPIAELVGITSLVASLIFVGLQLKQSHDVATAAHYQNRADQTMNLHLALIEAGQVQARFRKWVSDDLPASEINIYGWLWIGMDNHHYQYQLGFMDENTWQAQLRTLESIYANCAMRFVWDWRKAGLRSDFVQIVDSLEDHCEEADRPSPG